jgi:translation elongation factor EF-Tu-like GTPase
LTRYFVKQFSSSINDEWCGRRRQQKLDKLENAPTERALGIAIATAMTECAITNLPEPKSGSGGMGGMDY